jgi:hypothetical protein
MNASDLTAYVDHFRRRVLQDAMAEATNNYWQRRADTFERARPRPGDFRGQATDADLAEADRRCAAAALACRQRATLADLQPDGEAELIADALREAA